MTGDIPTARQAEIPVLREDEHLEDAEFAPARSGRPVQFFALDTQSVALSARQLERLDTELSRSQARWKVVYGHHPISRRSL